MLLSSNMIKIHDTFGMKESFDVYAQVGMQGMDFNTDVAEYYTDEHDKQFYYDLRDYARSKGITICQAHAPFPSSYVEEDKTEKRFYEIVQGMKNASYLGAPMIVVHACSHLDYSVEGNAEKLYRFNLDFYRRLIPYAREIGIKIAIENAGRVTADPEILCKLYDELNDPVFTICFDVGHCLLYGYDPSESIKMLGDRLVNGCTHIHDNFGDADSHTLPYYGAVNWDEVMKALADIDYKGDLNYEASGFLKRLPKELYLDGFAYMAKVGHYLIGRFEYYKNNK
ncbi:MAG: sugar phosphate isomerase/epimerase [Ruminococcaceae bacterium]|nr:sugar phosphate isomerase/epimerase [Oscillospiraceae bacterium]